MTAGLPARKEKPAVIDRRYSSVRLLGAFFRYLLNLQRFPDHGQLPQVWPYFFGAELYYKVIQASPESDEAMS